MTTKMRALSSLGIGLSLVSGFLFLALVAELYYLLWWKKRVPNRETEQEEEEHTSPAKELLYLFCWKKPHSLSSTALNPQEISTAVNISGDDSQHKDLSMPLEEEAMEAELMRLHSLSGPPRFLFTIKEETKEDLESEDGRSKSRRSSRGRSLSDVFVSSETPFMTPLSSPLFFTPPLTPFDHCSKKGFNPLFESAAKGDELQKVKCSPPPKFKFLRDAEEKLYRKTLNEEAVRLHKFAESASPSKVSGEEEGSFITILIGKSRERSSSSSQVNPLPSPPPSLSRPAHERLSSYLSSTE